MHHAYPCQAGAVIRRGVNGDLSFPKTPAYESVEIPFRDYDDPGSSMWRDGLRNQ